MNKSNLSTWLSALCAALMIVLLVVQSNQRAEIMSLRQQQAMLMSSVEQRNREDATAIQQQTAVIHRALGKIIPIQLPETLTVKLKALEKRIANEKSWPKDAAGADRMLAELRDLVHQIPPWAEEDLLPQLNAVRWGVQSLQLLQANAKAEGDALEVAAEAFSNQLSVQPDGASTNIATALQRHQKEAVEAYTNYRRDTAIRDAKRQLSLSLMTEGLAVWQRLSEWTNNSTRGPEVLQLRHQLQSRIVETEISKFRDDTKAFLQKLTTVTNDTLRQAGYVRALESVTVQRLKLIEDADTPQITSRILTTLSAVIESLIKTETERQKQHDAYRVRGYQQWALRNISGFRKAFDTAMAHTKPGTFYGKNSDPNYKGVADAMVLHLVPISPMFLDPAVAKVYSQAFEDGWNKLGDKDEKYLQTYVAKSDAITAKKTLQNYQE